MSKSSTDLTQPDVSAPLNIMAYAQSYKHDPRITIVSFVNKGNTDAPKKMKRMVLLPVGVEMPPILALAPDIVKYSVFIDSVVERIFITLGVQDLGYKKVLVLAAVVEFVSLSEGVQRHTHACSELE